MPTPNSNDPMKDENTARFRSILNSSEEEEAPKPAKPSRSVLDLLPRPATRTESAPQTGTSPTLALRAQPEATARVRSKATLPSVQRDPVDPSEKRRFGPAFWTVTGILSLVVNAVLIAVVILLLSFVSKLNIQLKQLTSYLSLPEDTVRGLYDNFVLMDNAHIRTNIDVTTEIPVQFNLDINTQTEVTLSQDTLINQVRVTLTTGGLNITNAPATLVLPAGTRIPINLVLTVPVDKRVPVSLTVPVDISLKQTELHDPFLGLRKVVEPLYCIFDKSLISPEGVLTCQQSAP